MYYKYHFTGSKGVVIDPQTIYDKNMRDAKLKDVEIKGSFNGVNITNTNFEDAIYADERETDNEIYKTLKKKITDSFNTNNN